MRDLGIPHDKFNVKGPLWPSDTRLGAAGRVSNVVIPAWFWTVGRRMIRTIRTISSFAFTEEGGPLIRPQITLPAESSARNLAAFRLGP